MTNKRYIQKRLTPNNLVMELHQVFHEYVDLLTKIKEGICYIENELNCTVGFDNYRNYEIYEELKINELAKVLYSKLTPILFEYGIRQFDISSIEMIHDMDYNESFTFHELIAYLVKTLMPKDVQTIEYQIITGDYLKIYHHLERLSKNKSHFANELIFNQYQRALNRINTVCAEQVDLHSDIKLIQRLVTKERPRKPIVNQYEKSVIMCPHCSTVLYDRTQKYCHNCAQKLGNY